MLHAPAFTERLASGRADTAEPTVGRVLASVLAHPNRAFLGTLALALSVAIWTADSPAVRAQSVGLSSLIALWYVVWVRSSWKRPVWKRELAQGLFTLLGGALLGLVVLKDFAFVIVAVPFVPRCLLVYPLRWSLPFALLVVLPADFAFRDLAVRNPSAILWVVVASVFVLLVLGVLLRGYAVAAEQRRWLSAELASSERRAGTLEERQRFARDIHDTLAQGFAAIVVHLETASLERLRDPALADRHVESATELARQSLEEARRMMGAMLPAPLDGRDLAEAIARVTVEWSERTGIACETVCTGEAEPLDREIEVALLRVVQEALSNVWKYSGAHQVTVTLSYLGDVVLLDVRDDGVGVSGAAPSDSVTVGATGLGIAGMRERIERLGGKFGIESAPHDGTTVSVSLPAVPSTTATWATPSESLE